MTATINPRWKERSQKLELDPDREAGSCTRVVVAKGLADLTAKLDAPVLAEQEPTVAPSGAEAAKASDDRLRLAAVHHALGIARITDQKVLDEIERRFKRIPLDVENNPQPIVVTAANPLIINSTQSVTNYSTVTIEPGGYIEISVDCLFQASELVKKGGEEETVGGADIVITGTAGQNGQAGDEGVAGKPGKAGEGAACDCCGGTCKNNGSAGSSGGNGGDGKEGMNGKDGAMSPSVVIEIDELKSTITLLNIGGQGGDGGAGGAGGAGGDGGPGGGDKTCGAVKCDGGWGGNGGNGANGANGGNAGDGGNGGTSIVYFKTENGSKVLVNNGTAEPGTPGAGGSVGAGGAGGPAGGRGANPGSPGNAGTKVGSKGTTGVPGRAGTVQLNPPTEVD